MRSRALAGRYAGATANLEAIARHYVGADVRVTWQPSSAWLGLARRTPAGFEILLNPSAPAAQLGHTFFHEVAHLVCGHCEVVSKGTPADLAHDEMAAHIERLTPAERAAIGPVIDSREAAADSWAADTLRAFQGRFGPFLKAIR